MRFAFRALPAAGGGTLTPRPVVDIALEGLADAPMECLLDTGALRTRMSAELAPLAGIELAGSLTVLCRRAEDRRRASPRQPHSDRRH
jgi:hypothetical protein